MNALYLVDSVPIWKLLLLAGLSFILGMVATVIVQLDIRSCE
jgi:hypothetical protein